MKLPEEFLQSLEGVPGFEKDSFLDVHEKAESITSIRLNPAKPVETRLQKDSAEDQRKHTISPLTASCSQVPWAVNGYYLEQRPSFTFDPLFHAGCYYVQEASSMFLEQAIRQLADLSQPLKVLDLCAAPGGKSTHLQSLLSSQSLLVSNEVIRQRSMVLTDNIIKWGCSNVFVSNNDPRAFQKLPGFFDIMVVDAPCSGSGLFRKDKDAIEEWSLGNVDLCSQRQQRILADALPALKEEGILVYSTCSYSTEEDEKIMDWLVTEMGLRNLDLKIDEAWGIVPTRSAVTAATGYRFYPDKVRGEGFFLACFRKKEDSSSLRFKLAKPEFISAKDKEIINSWVKTEGFALIRWQNGISAIPQDLLQDFSVLQPVLNLQYAGVSLGDILKDRLVPHHALAQSLMLSQNVPSVELTYDEAIKYLQRQDLSLDLQNMGWQLVSYQKKPLGWINALKNRVNNYYPKEIRILKQNNTPFEK